MTILVALANNEYALIVADRRTSSGSTIIDDEFNKLCVLFCEDARVAIAFTGLASCQDLNTSEWIASTLNEISHISSTLHDLLYKLSYLLEEKFLKIGVLDKRLSILICGFGYWGETPEPITYVISNFEVSGVADKKFTIRRVQADDDIIVEFAGNTSVFARNCTSKLQELTLKKLKPQELLRFTVKHMQHTAGGFNATGSIGTQYNSAIIPALKDTAITTTYHSLFNSWAAYGPNVVIAGSIICLGYEIFSGTILAGQEIRKKDQCWCESGKQFRHCHMKKFGSFYVKHNMFKKPLYACVQAELIEPRKSGKFCGVSSGYS